MVEKEKADKRAESCRAEVVGQNTISVPPEIAKKLGLSAGAKLDLALENGRLEIRPDIHSLARVYIEPSSRCNLNCRTCIRRTWDEPLGDMDMGVFRKLLAGLKELPHLESAMLGGFGEPTLHPAIVEMTASLKALGLRTEMVSNGTLLEDPLLEGLKKARLDRLWVSFDGVEDLNYQRVREGASFRALIKKLRRLRGLNRSGGHVIKVGVAFVITRKNVADLGGIETLAKRCDADRVSLTNVMPYTPEMEKEMACGEAMTLGTLSSGPGTGIDLPRLDLNEASKEGLWRLAGGFGKLSLMGRGIGARVDECRFVRERCTFVRWDGKVAPCMALLHSHELHFLGYQRSNKSHSFGDLSARGLKDIWESGNYAAFREKVRGFDFSPCHVCGGCGLAEENREDCAGNSFPAVCGGCLWAQGIIQCP